MDQNASNGPSKGSWREKLGLGNGKKDMPKIADEFKPTPAEPKPVPKAPGAAPRAPQPVTKLAPMAPRTPGARSMPAPKPASAPAPTPTAAKPAVAVAQDSLAERLKAQRQAAEKLAEQRVSMAREKAEARAADSARKEEPRPAPAPSDKPKFTFADEEIAAAKREAPASGAKEFQAGLLRKSPPPPPPPINGPAVTPPRPTLGGEKPIAGTGAGEMRRLQPQLGASTQSSLGYRPLDPPSFQSALKRGPGIQTPQRGLNAPRPSFGDNGFGDARRREQADEYRRRPEPSLRGDDREALRAEPRRGPQRGRRQDYDDDMGDVFEDEAPPQRRRANARDYNQAYQEYDEADRDEAPRRRSSGPLLILLAILVVAGLFVTGLWYYYFHMKPVSVTSGGSVPVITAPDGPAKVNPEPNLESTGPDLAPAATAKKKIYDRILGEADTGGQMVPTEEQPSPVEPLPTPQPDNSGMLPEPVAPTGQTGLSNDSAATPIPEPAGGQNSGEMVPTPEPLPLPPTPGNDGTQGSMPVPDTNTLAAEVQNATRATSADALSAAPEPPAPEPPTATASGESLAMAEANSNDGAATDEQATPPSDDEPAAAAPVPDEVQPPKSKTKQKTATSTSKKQKTAASDAATNGEPLVLVAPSEPPPPPAAAESIAPSTENVAATTTTETTTSSNSLFGTGAKKLTGKRAENAGSTAKTISSSQQASTSAQDQVASIDTTQRTTSSALQPEPAPKAKSTTTSSGGTGYVAQVASLRSEAEARAELDRLRGSYGDLIGTLSTRITKATVAGTTRYRLGFGPLPSRSEAAKLCSSLIAAGERDCAVRGL